MSTSHHPYSLKEQINENTLTAVVSHALNNASIRLTDWEITSAHGGYAHVLTGGIYRLTGTAQTGHGRVPWSLILKIVQTAPHPAGPDSPHYWKRELLAYQSGLLDDLAPGLSAPRCYGAEEIDETTYWLWLEDVADELGEEWPLARYELAGHHLGAFNGRYLDPSSRPIYPWLSRRWLAAWLQDYAHLPPLIQDEQTWAHPLVKNILPHAFQDRLLKLWHNQERLLQTLTQLPQTFCHLDAYRPNLFARSLHNQSQTVIIDWDKAGFGAVGEELGGLVPASMIWFRVEASHAKQFGELALAGYLAGLRQSSWQGDEEIAWLGFATSSVLRWGIPGVFWLKGVVDDTYPEKWGQWWGRPVPLMQRQWVQVTAYLLDWADEVYQFLSL